jgi:hypothetical protein
VSQPSALISFYRSSGNRWEYLSVIASGSEGPAHRSGTPARGHRGRLDVANVALLRVQPAAAPWRLGREEVLAEIVIPFSARLGISTVYDRASAIVLGSEEGPLSLGPFVDPAIRS